MATRAVEFSGLILIVTLTLMSSAVKGCTDRYVWIADGSYPCKGLLDPTDSVGLYPNRDYFCNTYKLTYCCKTCKLVNEELKTRELEQQTIPSKDIEKPIVADN